MISITSFVGLVCALLFSVLFSTLGPAVIYPGDMRGLLYSMFNNNHGEA